jgi:hypothetical protein
VPFGKAFEHLFQRYPAFQSSKGRADAEMRAATKGQVTTGFAMYVESVGILKVPLVAIGGGEHHEQGAARWDGLSLEAHIVCGDIAANVWPWRLEAQQLFDRCWDQ